MAVFKCKICGGDLEIQEGITVCECEYCCTKQTIPSLDNEKKLNLFNRANRLRLNSEFDKAANIYESIIAEFPEEAEGYWGLVLCNYGIEYVDDPATAKKIPTCHRAAFESVANDENYQLALEYADVVSQKVYRDEAREIDRIMSEILSISKTEKPYDIFICYKETDMTGGRTIDSVIAQDVYDALTDKGYRVFFSRISLEDKIGKQYEPYIFAALNSAKVMLAFGTKYEYFHAVWVKNEWSRFLKLMAKDKTKNLVPCYKDMDVYDMPDEFKALQAQDMGKVGAIQDLVRGVEKLLSNKDTAPMKATVTVDNSSPQIEPLLKRAFMFLEDGDWKSADEYCEKVLDINPECAGAYLGKLLAELHVNTQDGLRDYAEPFGNSSNYQKALRYGDSELQRFLEDCVKYIISRNETRNENARLEGIYNNAENAMMLASYEKAISLFESISDYKDSATLANEARKRLVAQKRCDKKIGIIVVACVVSLIVLIVSLVLGINIDNNVKYNNAVELMEEGRYQEALQIFWSLNGIRDCDKYVSEILSEIAVRETISAGDSHTVALQSDGTVIAAGDNKFGQCDVSNWTDIIAVSAGGNHTVALKSNGTVIATGDNIYGQCDVEDWTDIVAISAGDDHTVGLKSNGTVVATEYTDESFYFGQCDVDNWIDIIAISVGDNHTVGLKSDGTVVADCDYDSDDCDVEDWTDIVAISAGNRHTVGLKSDGTVVAVGYNYEGRCDVEDWSEIVAISAGGDHTVGLKSDGTVVAVGSNGSGQCDVEDWADIVAISAGDDHTVGLKSDGTVVSVGYNYYGRCDVEEWHNIMLPD